MARRRTDLANLGRELARTYENQSIRIENQTQEAMYTAAKMVETDAKRLAPVDTGMLRASISTRQEGNKFYIGTLTPYSEKVEYGIGQRPQPYLRPALYMNKQAIKQLLERAARGN